MLFRRLLWIVFAVLGPSSLALTLWAQATRLPADSSSAADQLKLAIGPGDLLEVNVYDVPELILKVRVSDEGNVTLPLVGSMHWAGLTPPQAERMLHDELVAEDYVKTPQVSVFIAEYATQGIAVTGEVNQPGLYPLLGPHTVFDAISAAGGLTENAGNIITIHHKANPNHPETVLISSSGSLEDPNKLVEPGDMISVSKAGLIYVVGEVNKPGAFALSNNTHLTVVKAIALAMGTTSRGRLKRVCVVRHRNGSVSLITLDLKRVLKQREPDIELRADDVVYVPTSAVRTTTDILQKASIGAAAAAVLAY